MLGLSMPPGRVSVYLPTSSRARDCNTAGKATVAAGGAPEYPEGVQAPVPAGAAFGAAARCAPRPRDWE